MGVDLKQEVRLSQQLILTPQLQQAIKLLQLNRMELEEAIQEELASNPFLEEAEAPAEEEPVWEVSAYSTVPRASRRKDPYEELPALEETLGVEMTLQEYLLWQLRMSDLGPDEMRIGSYIIGNIDEDGYLKASPEEIAQDLGVEVQKVEEVLKVVQDFDPPGVGARDLRECLLIQVRQREDSPKLLERLLLEGFEDLMRRDLKRLSERLGVKVEEVEKALRFLKLLETKPGRAFSSKVSEYVVPDVFVYKKGEDYEVVLNEEGLPKLKISAYYRELLREKKEGLPQSYLRQKFREAQWFLKGLEQRQKTLERITMSIFKFQREFLEKGVEALRPLVLKDVAEDTGLHESTVSRAIAGKYVWTPQGIFPLKFFFSSKVGEGLVEMSSKKVKKLIEDLIAQEDPKAPLSDQEIAKVLKECYGLEIARRTVAKYRESLGIPPSKDRKRSS